MALDLRLSLLRVNAVIIATAVLHNICRSKNLEEVPPEVAISEHEENDDVAVSVANNTDEINNVLSENIERETLIAQYFSK